MIARAWRGWTKSVDAAAYSEFLRDQLLPATARKVSGFRGGYVLHRNDGPETEFLVVTLFESLADVETFAGDDLDAPVIEPEAERLLVRWDARVAHYQAGSGLISR